jgi:hypothetical protein
MDKRVLAGVAPAAEGTGCESSDRLPGVGVRAPVTAQGPRACRGRQPRRLRWIGWVVFVVPIAAPWSGLSVLEEVVSRHGTRVACAQGAVSPADLPAGVFDPDELPHLPGITAPRPAPPEIQEKVQTLAAQRDRRMQGRHREPIVAGVPEPPLDSGAPPRMDAGDPNPDRINAAPRSLAGE